MKVKRAQLNANQKRFVIIASRWNEFVVKQLVEGALDELARYGDAEIEVTWVPGTWEVPLACKLALASQPDGVIALGCILQGATTHAQLLSSDVSSALMKLQMESEIPIAWGILTPETEAQAIERAGMKLGNKGREAALAALEMACLKG